MGLSEIDYLVKLLVLCGRWLRFRAIGGQSRRASVSSGLVGVYESFLRSPERDRPLYCMGRLLLVASLASFCEASEEKWRNITEINNVFIFNPGFFLFITYMRRAYFNQNTLLLE